MTDKRLQQEHLHLTVHERNLHFANYLESLGMVDRGPCSGVHTSLGQSVCLGVWSQDWDDLAFSDFWQPRREAKVCNLTRRLCET